LLTGIRRPDPSSLNPPAAMRARRLGRVSKAKQSGFFNTDGQPAVANVSTQAFLAGFC
jgi:hypothetical protein